MTAPDLKDTAYRDALRIMRSTNIVIRVAVLGLIGALGFLALVLCPFLH